MEESWVDFKLVKKVVTMQMALQYYGIKLRASGKELRGRCPIHKGEGIDTFHVNIERSIFNCFSCKAKGNVLDFVAALENCSIKEAALKLQNAFVISGSGIPETNASGENTPLATKKEEYASFGEARNKPLEFRLKGIDPSHPYLRERGIEKETAEYFGAGFFPGRGSMHGRVVIPIENEVAELVAYVGRSIDGSEPKYKLPPGFKKSQVVFNLGRARDDSDGTVVLVEGFFDCMKVTQAEFPCISLMGCSMSAEQLRLIGSHFHRVIVMLDGDEAGRGAALDIAGRLARHVFVRIVDVGEGRQPDQLSKEELRGLLGDLF